MYLNQSSFKWHFHFLQRHMVEETKKNEMAAKNKMETWSHSSNEVTFSLEVGLCLFVGRGNQERPFSMKYRCHLTPQNPQWLPTLPDRSLCPSLKSVSFLLFLLSSSSRGPSKQSFGCNNTLLPKTLRPYSSPSPSPLPFPSSPRLPLPCVQSWSLTHLWVSSLNPTTL